MSRIPDTRGGVPTSTVLALYAIAWAALYGGLRTYWALGHQPNFPRTGAAFTALDGWFAVGLCALLLVLLPLLAVHRIAVKARWCGWILVAAGWLGAGGLVLGAAPLGLDVVAVLLPGMGLPFSVPASLDRLLLLTGAILVGAVTRDAQRRLRHACPACGRGRSVRTTSPATDVSRWGLVGTWTAVAGCALRFADQATVGQVPAAQTSSILFTIGLALAGTLLPLALGYRWGRVWPRWVRPLAGRAVPRWLVLGPAMFCSAGFTLLFGSQVIQMVFTPPTAFGPYGVPFLWLAMCSYTLWGIGLTIATISYHHHTRPECETCGS